MKPPWRTTLVLSVVFLVLTPLTAARPVVASRAPQSTAPTNSAIHVGAYALTTAPLNLRTEPSSTAPVTEVLPNGSRVFVNSGPHNDGWYDVTVDTTSGYVDGHFLALGTAHTITMLPTTRKIVALTFDAGADAGYTAQILDTLATHGIKGSFGVTGHWAEENPDLLRRIANEGHLIINHTYTHRSFTGQSPRTAPLSYDERASELSRTEAAIGTMSGASTLPYFRPPYGDEDQSVLEDVWSLGYTENVMWSVDSLGWDGLSQDQIVQRCVQGLHPGAIYLFHVGSASQDGLALPSLIEKLRARDYGFATIDGRNEVVGGDVYIPLVVGTVEGR